ncbi:hypothetical protein ABBQ38_012673 [Trebouxia sp. C0009 RCD-2024]
MLEKGSLTINLVAKVAQVWQDREAMEYFEMSLTDQTDTPFTMIARHRTTQQPSTDNTYAVAGELFFDPGREWTRTYLLITALQDLKENIPAEPTCPLFNIVGTVHASGSSEATSRYRVFDEYECAGYMQSVKLCFGEDLASGDGAGWAGNPPQLGQA